MMQRFLGLYREFVAGSKEYAPFGAGQGVTGG
jgi:hypothetical protein